MQTLHADVQNVQSKRVHNIQKMLMDIYLKLFVSKPFKKSFYKKKNYVLTVFSISLKLVSKFS